MRLGFWGINHSSGTRTCLGVRLLLSHCFPTRPARRAGPEPTASGRSPALLGHLAGARKRNRRTHRYSDELVSRHLGKARWAREHACSPPSQTGACACTSELGRCVHAFMADQPTCPHLGQDLAHSQVRLTRREGGKQWTHKSQNNGLETQRFNQIGFCL